MNIVECGHCKQKGEVGSELVPYSVLNSKGAPITKWLHGGCAEQWFVKYRRWRESLSGRVSGGT